MKHPSAINQADRRPLKPRPDGEPPSAESGRRVLFRPKSRYTSNAPPRLVPRPFMKAVRISTGSRSGRPWPG